MNPISKIFHNSTKVKYEKGWEKPVDFSTWPKEWSIIYFKSYPRLAKVLLPKPDLLNFPFGEAIAKRRSEREFSRGTVGLKDLSQLLFYSAGLVEEKYRAYPSAGGRFPLEVYLFNLQDSQELKPGIYHYNVKEHSLEKLLEDDKIREQIYPEAVWQEMMLKAPLLLVISAVFERNMMKYQERGYRYILFEAGHLGQNICLTAAALGLKSCALGGFGEDKLHELLDIDGDTEGVLYAFALGR